MLLECLLPLKEAQLSNRTTVQLLPDGVCWKMKTCPRLCSHCLWWCHYILPRKVQALSIKLASSGFVPLDCFLSFFTLEIRRVRCLHDVTLFKFVFLLFRQGLWSSCPPWHFSADPPSSEVSLGAFLYLVTCKWFKDLNTRYHICFHLTLSSVSHLFLYSVRACLLSWEAGSLKEDGDEEWWTRMRKSSLLSHSIWTC